MDASPFVDDVPEGSRDREKALRAAVHPERPGDRCHASPGSWVPTINRERCEGKKDCVDVCPYDVFELGTLTDAEYNSLSLRGRFKAQRHHFRTSRTPRAASCQACGLCVVACPEDAIELVPPGSR
jgi:NAD-dependent dihydropyrimidine dehydrogenase PreA subunit